MNEVTIEDRILSYLGNGGLFNPEMMEHDKVRDLIITCRDEIAALRVHASTAAKQNTKLREACFVFLEARKHDGYGMDDAEKAIRAALIS